MAGLAEFFHRQESTLSPQELLDTSFILFQEGKQKEGIYFARGWNTSITIDTEDFSLIIKRSKKHLLQELGELAVISSSQGDLSYYRFVNGRIKEEHRNTRISVMKIKRLLGRVVSA